MTGTVIRAHNGDSVSVPHARVTLHRVGRDTQGPLDSMVTGADGRFRFRYPADTSAVFLLSSGYDGIEYFSSPLGLDHSTPDTGLVLPVYDTSSVAPLEVQSRHVVVSLPGRDGTRNVLEIVVLANTGEATRVAGDSAHPAWGTTLPTGALGPEVGQGDVSPESVVFRNDSLLLFAPVAPGPKQVVFGYTLPATPGRVRFRFPEGAGAFTLLLEERNLPVSGGGIVAADTQAIGGRTFAQWTGAPAAGSVVTVSFPGSSTRWLLPLLVGAVGLVLVVVLARTLRRPVPVPAAPLSLLDQLAALDRQYAGREAEVGAAEWQRYQDERGRLKAALEQELAGK